MINSSHNREMTMKRFQQLLDACGAQSHRWPEQERKLALRLLTDSKDATQRLQEALQLDDLLDQVKPHSPSSELLASVLAGADLSRKKSLAIQLWPFGSLWKPVGALACSAFLGLALGAQTVWPLSSHEETAALLENEVVQLAYGIGWDGENG